MPIFTKSFIETQCDECQKPFAITSGGVCERCRRILCNAHLHGTLLRRVSTMAFGARIVCVRCRAGLPPAAAEETT